MEIDTKTFRALASPTRIEILRAVMERGSTPTKLSEEVGKTKSTVSSHLETLMEADLVSKEEAEGRRRVEYSPTKKAETIVKGRERKVRFSVATGLIAMVAGGASIWTFFKVRATGYQSADSGEVSALAAEAGARTADAGSGSTVPEAELVFLLLGMGLITVAAGSFLFGMMINRLDTNPNEEY